MNDILKHISPFKNNFHVIKDNQGIGDIIRGMLLTHGKYKVDYDKIYNRFDTGNVLTTCKKIYDYLEHNTHYVIESDERQTLRSPAAILKLGGNPNIGLDCKSFALFSAGILDAINRNTNSRINWCYRFASYRADDKLPHHVFVVVNPSTNNEIWIDNVIKPFNYKKPYKYKIDKNMSLIQVSGIGDSIGRKNRGKKLKQAIKAKVAKGKKLLLKVNPATTPARNAFLLLVKLNVFNLAVNLLRLVQNNPSKLKSFWEKIGGSYNSLVNNINIGSKKKAHQPTVNGIGALPALAAAIASATPIILKIKAMLKAAGINTDKLTKSAEAVITDLVEKKIEDSSENNSVENFAENNNVSPSDSENSFSDVSDNDSFTENDSFDNQDEEGSILGFLDRQHPMRRSQHSLKNYVKNVC